MYLYQSYATHLGVCDMQLGGVHVTNMMHHQQLSQARA